MAGVALLKPDRRYRICIFGASRAALGTSRDFARSGWRPDGRERALELSPALRYGHLRRLGARIAIWVA
jgi:hypothetical protein